MTRIVGKWFYDWHCTTVGVLTCQHQFEAFNHLFRDVVDHTQHILDCITITHTITLTTIDQRSRTAPCVGDQVVEWVPHVNHAIERSVRSLC